MNRRRFFRFALAGSAIAACGVLLPAEPPAVIHGRVVTIGPGQDYPNLAAWQRGEQSSGGLVVTGCVFDMRATPEGTGAFFDARDEGLSISNSVFLGPGSLASDT